MKVLIVPTWYPSGADKLMGIYHKEFTESLNKFGIQADMLYVDRQRLSKPLKYLFMKKRVIEKEANYQVYKYRKLNLSPISFEMEMSSYVKTFKKGLNDYIKKNGKPDLIHAMVSIPAGYAAVLNGLDIPVMVTEHGGDLERLYTRDSYKKYGKFVLENATISTVSNYMKDIVLKYKDYCAVIPNQVNTEIFKNNKKRRIDKTFNLISVCALRELKRLEVAFAAIRKCIDSGMDLHYTIVGDGFYEDFFKESCKSFGLDAYVDFVGRKSKIEIAKYLEDAHALLISSELESFAIPAIEALASGLPIITTDCKGPTEFVDDSCGSIAKINDPDDLARAIKEVYDNYSKYDKKHLEQVAEKFSEKNVVNIAKTEYEKILNKRKG